MSKTHRDKDYHFLRNSKKYLGKWQRQAHCGIGNKLNTVENAENEKKYDKVWKKYGMKSMVGNKRRRNTTRKSNQRTKQMLHQIKRAKEKNSFKKEILQSDE